MPKPLDYRRRLLRIVDAFSDPTDTAHAHALRLIDRLKHDRRRGLQSIDDLVWGTLISELSDSLFFNDPDFLHTTRETLLHGSPELHRAYLNYDFRPDFTDVEREWHTQLTELATWLLTRPFPLTPHGPLPRDDETTSQAEYERRAHAIRELSDRTPPPAYVGEEALYHYILRTASTALTSINPWGSSRLGRLVMDGQYTEYHWDPENPAASRYPPDADISIEWAERALRAVTLQGWVWFTWQITRDAYLVSLH